jgi:hypothetical protein
MKRCNAPSAISEMADIREQRACIEFCFNLGKTATECYEMLKIAFGEQAMGFVTRNDIWKKAGVVSSTFFDVQANVKLLLFLVDTQESGHELWCDT